MRSRGGVSCGDELADSWRAFAAVVTVRKSGGRGGGVNGRLAGVFLYKVFATPVLCFVIACSVFFFDFFSDKIYAS